MNKYIQGQIRKDEEREAVEGHERRGSGGEFTVPGHVLSNRISEVQASELTPGGGLHMRPSFDQQKALDQSRRLARGSVSTRDLGTSAEDDAAPVHHPALGLHNSGNLLAPRPSMEGFRQTSLSNQMGIDCPSESRGRSGTMGRGARSSLISTDLLVHAEAARQQGWRVATTCRLDNAYICSCGEFTHGPDQWSEVDHMMTPEQMDAEMDAVNKIWRDNHGYAQLLFWLPITLVTTGFSMCIIGYLREEDAYENGGDLDVTSMNNILMAFGLLVFCFGGIYGGWFVNAYCKSVRNHAAGMVKVFLQRRNHAYHDLKIWWHIVPDHFANIVHSGRWYVPLNLNFKIEILDQATPEERGLSSPCARGHKPSLAVVQPNTPEMMTMAKKADAPVGDGRRPAARSVTDPMGPTTPVSDMMFGVSTGRSFRDAQQLMRASTASPSPAPAGNVNDDDNDNDDEEEEEEKGPPPPGPGFPTEKRASSVANVEVEVERSPALEDAGGRIN